MPARTSIRAPTRPSTVTLPAVGYITRVSTFNSVDLPAPLAPISPHDCPGSARKLTSESTHRQRALEPLVTRSLTAEI